MEHGVPDGTGSPTRVRAMVVAAVLALPWLVFWYLLDPVNGKVLGNDFLASPTSR
jgi:hypothetical protein